MWAILGGILTGALPKIVEGLQNLWATHGERLVMYFKGKSDANKTAKLKQLEQESKVSSKAQEKVDELAKEARDKHGEPADGSDIFGVRKPPARNRWE